MAMDRMMTTLPTTKRTKRTHVDHDDKLFVVDVGSLNAGFDFMSYESRN